MSSPIAEARLEGPSQWKQMESSKEGTSVRFAFRPISQVSIGSFHGGAALGLETEGLLTGLLCRKISNPGSPCCLRAPGIKATANKSLRLTVRASDDYGLAEFAILYRVNGEEDQGGSPWEFRLPTTRRPRGSPFGYLALAVEDSG